MTESVVHPVCQIPVIVLKIRLGGNNVMFIIILKD